MRDEIKSLAGKWINSLQNISNGVTNQWQAMLQDTPSLKQFADDFNSYQETQMAQKKKQNYDDNVRIMSNLYDAKLNTNNHYVASESDKAIKKTQVAYWISEFYNTNYEKELAEAWIDFNSMTNEEIIDWYTELNPNSYNILKNYVLTETDINNPLELYSEMWRLPTKTEEDLAMNLDWFLRFIEDTSENMASWINETYQWFRNFVTGIQWMLDKDAEYQWAFENYAYDVLWKDIDSLSDIEVFWITEALKNRDIYNEFKPTPFKATTKSAAWISDTMFSIFMPWAKFVISALWADPLTEPAMNFVWKSQESIWEIVNWLVPPLWLYRSQLTDWDKKEFDAFVWSLVTIWMFGKYWGKQKTMSKDNYTSIIDKIWTDKIIQSFNDKIKPTNLRPVNRSEIIWENGEVNLDGLDAQNKLLSLRDQVLKNAESTEDLYNQAAKIWATSRVYENKLVSDALWQISEGNLRNIKTYPELYNSIRENISYLGKLQDSILDTFERTVTEENGKVWGKIDFGNWVITEEYDTPINDYIDFMEEIWGDWKTRSITKAITQYYNGGKLTTSHLYKMKRALNAAFRKFKKWIDSPEEMRAYTKRVSRISEQLTQIAREMINKEPAFKSLWLDNVLEYTDKLQSANLYTRDLIWDLMNKINRYNRDIPNNTTIRTTWKILWWLLNLSSRPSWLANWLKWPEKLTPAGRQAQLNSMLNKRSDLSKKLDSAKTTAEIEKVLDKFNKEYQAEYGKVSEWPIEWEVIDPAEWERRDDMDAEQALNEIFETVASETIYPESRMLNEDPKYNNWNSVDYTTPTRVTPEWYAARYGQTLESWKKWLRNWWMDEANIEAYIDNISKNEFKYKQEPLVRVIEEEGLIKNPETQTVVSAEEAARIEEMKKKAKEKIKEDAKKKREEKKKSDK